MAKRWFANEQSINAFLGYQYLPDQEYDLAESVIESALNHELQQSESELIREGKSALSRVFEEMMVDSPDNTTHVLPLSGGLDSRTILGGLLDHVDRNQIVTITFGIPGTLDYDLGRKVAEKAGVENHAYDLSPESFPWDDDLLLKNAREYERPTKLFRARSALDYAFDRLDEENCIYWSGFMGEASAGAHLPETESKTWDEALSVFIDKNFSIPQLTSDDFNPHSVLPKKPLLEKGTLSYDEQLDYGIRQPYFIRPAAVFKNRFETPYTHKEWLKFILNIPRSHRVDRSLFKKIVAKQYPKLFNIPTDAAHGLSIESPRYQQLMFAVGTLLEGVIKGVLGIEHIPNSVNHFDWNYELQNSPTIREFAMRQLSDLKDRNVVAWVDIDNIWDRAMSGEQVGDEIHQLTSLEIYLKAENM